MELAQSGLGNERMSETGTFLREIVTTEEKQNSYGAPRA